MSVQQESELCASLDAEALDGVEGGHDGHVEVVDIDVVLGAVVADSCALHGVEGTACECKVIAELPAEFDTTDEAYLQFQFIDIASYCGYGSTCHGITLPLA